MSSVQDLNLNETALFAGVPRARVEKAIENGIAQPRTSVVARSAVRLPIEAVAFFRSMDRSGAESLPVSTRRLAWARIIADCHSKVALGEGLTLDVPALAGDALGRAAAYARSRGEYIVSDPEILGGTPVIRGTRLGVHAIRARLDGGEPMSDLMVDYPGIPRDAFEAARDFAAANPERGRPRSGRPWRKAGTKPG